MERIVNLGADSYPVYIEEGILSKLHAYITGHEKIAIVTDSGVPEKWVQMAADQFENCEVICFEQGEENKTVSTWAQILSALAQAGFHRKDAIIAVGGGVCGDMAGFAAACYMRGIAFYNVPTTVLSQVDSSVGGKTAVDLDNYKNIVGAFYQPKAVFIDPQTLSTLPERQIHNGLVEALKMGCILEEDLIAAFEQEDLDLVRIIARSIDLKAQIVEADEKEGGLRAILNFGHTIGHALESAYGLHTYLHGECVAMGMPFFITDPDLKDRLQAIYAKLHLPSLPDYKVEEVMAYLKNDKKSQGNGVKTVVVAKAGQAQLVNMTYDQLEALLQEGL